MREVLIVEDDEGTRDSWSRDVRDFNREDRVAVKFKVTFAKNRMEAFSLLSRTRFDCAVVDLRLPDGEEASAETPLGNDVLNKLLCEIGIPAVVYSGYEGEVSEEIRSSNIRVCTKKGGEARRILDAFADQEGLMLALDATRTQIAKASARIFNQSIWKRWETRWSKEEDREMISDVIVRQTASHIADSLAQSASQHHPDEFYVVPAVYPDRIDTGDLIEWDDKVHVVLTPRCNMANKPPSHLILAVCSSMPAWAEWRDSLVGRNNKKKEKAGKELRKHATQGHGIDTHFLPPLDDKGPWLVEFKEIRAINSEDISQLISNRFASISPNFVPNLVQRYSSYLGRIGQPDINADILSALCSE